MKMVMRNEKIHFHAWGNARNQGCEEKESRQECWKKTGSTWDASRREAEQRNSWKTGFHTQYITVLVSRYKANGLASITESHYHGNHRNLSYAEEEALLEPFRQASNAGKTVSVHDIETAYREAVGHSIGTSQIYYVLHRHGWRKVMPRSKHPKKASDEVIETSKKLTSESAN